MRDVFAALDSEQRGLLSVDDFRRTLRDLVRYFLIIFCHPPFLPWFVQIHVPCLFYQGFELGEREFRVLFARLDPQGSGDISYASFLAFLERGDGFSANGGSSSSIIINPSSDAVRYLI